jgi:hypothetical protein
MSPPLLITLSRENYPVNWKNFPALVFRENRNLCPENGDYSGSQMALDAQIHEFPCCFPCYQGNAHAETGSWADACTTIFSGTFEQDVGGTVVPV